MDLSNLSNVALDLYNKSIDSIRENRAISDRTSAYETDTAFSNILSSAMNLVNETNSLSEQAEQAEIDFALGNTDSIHEVTVAQQKAYLSLQYTVAIKNAVMDAYKEIMNIQI